MESFTQVRWRCQWCRKSFASKNYAGAHERACHHNPASRACTTCRHLERPCCAGPNPHCGCDGLNTCAVDAFHAGEHPETTDAKFIDWRRQCPMWATKKEAE